MTKLIIRFEQPDIHQPQPWPVAVDDNGIVTSGLGGDDGAQLIGFAVRGTFKLAVIASAAIAEPSSVEGMVPIFGKGGMFNWDLPVRRLEIIETPEEAEPEQRGAYLRTDEED